MSEPKRHHYLPVCYLSGFADSDGFLHGFDRSKCSYIQVRPKGIACEKHLYSMVAGDGSRDNSVERRFSQIESNFPALRERLESGGQLDRTQRGSLDSFAVAHFGRVPAMLKWFSEFGERAKTERFRQPSSAERLRGSLMEALPPDSEVETWSEERLTAMLSNLDSRLANENLTMAIMMMVMHRAYEALAKKSVVVLHAPKGRSFLTSDRPFLSRKVSKNDRGIEGLFKKGTVCRLPLSGRTVAFFLDTDGDSLDVFHQEASRKELAEVNDSIAIHSYRFLLADSKQRLASSVERSDLASLAPIECLEDPARSTSEPDE